jgi:nicotinic acid mononucleotide adenylyltransferase
MFMPTAVSSSKPHLIDTQDSRLEILKIFCQLLKEEETLKDNRITFEASEIEYELYKEPHQKSTATILTIDKLKKNYQNSTLCIGMGYDNMMQLPYWTNIEKYVDNVAKIYVGYRKLTNEEEGKTELFNIGNNGTNLRFEK